MQQKDWQQSKDHPSHQLCQSCVDPLCNITYLQSALQQSSDHLTDSSKSIMVPLLWMSDSHTKNRQQTTVLSTDKIDKWPKSMCINECICGILDQNFSSNYFWCHKSWTASLNQIFCEHRGIFATEQWMWKQLYSVRLCTCNILQWEVWTFSLRKKTVFHRLNALWVPPTVS